MPRQSVTLDLPDELYARIRKAAEENRIPLENMLVDSIELMFGDVPAEETPESLEKLTDEQLWAVVYRQIAFPQDARLRELTALSKRGVLTSDEQVEMEQLVDYIDHYVLLRSKALLLLKQHGHDVERRLKLGA
jgi:hypothetical protein